MKGDKPEEPDLSPNLPPISYPLLLWDGECGFCRRMVEYMQALVGDQITFAPYQDFLQADEVVVGEHRFEAAMLARGVHFIAPNGSVYRNGEAVVRSLAVSTLWRWSLLLELYRKSSVVSGLVEWGYRRVANNRVAASRVLKTFFSPDPRPATWQLSRWLFLRLLGLVSLVAFVSLWLQIDGLLGSEGVLPAQEYMDRVQEFLLAQSGSSEVGFRELKKLPTVFWWDASDSALHLVCGVGVLGSLLLITGLLPRVMLFLCWGLYLSLAGVGQLFLGYQWDVLLLEALFLGFWLAPTEMWPRVPWQRTREAHIKGARDKRGNDKRDSDKWFNDNGGQESRTAATGAFGRSSRRVPRFALWLLWLLTFKLMVMSGLAKLNSGDPAWSGLTALDYHYWTQPLPAWTAYYVDAMPAWLHAVSTAIMFFVELVVPFLIFGTRRMRHLAAVLLILLQVGIAATGTYGFFNLLSIALCVLLFDDDALRAIQPSRLKARMPMIVRAPQRAVRPWRLALATGGFLLLATLVITPVKRMAFPDGARWAWVTLLRADVRGLRTFNDYGLFATMTRYRREIRIEGSQDGQVWEPYVFPYKPGPPDRRPAFATPHMPRLDWQMWFAALSTCDSRRNSWLFRLQHRLLEGSADVQELFEKVPFDGQPPRYIRTVVYNYRFAGSDADGDWWQAEELGAFCPPMTLDEEGELDVANVASPEPAPPPPPHFIRER